MATKQDSFFLKNKKDNSSKKQFNNDHKKKRQDTFDKNRESNAEPTEKKPFDKKTYRLKKYSKKYKLEQWEEQRKKRLIREYHKQTKNDQNTVVGTYKPKSFDEDAPDGNVTTGKYVRHPDLIEKDNEAVKKTRNDPFKKAKEQFNKVKQDKLDKKQEMERVIAEKKEKLEAYKKKKQERFKKLSKKTKKGQPMMTGRLELLLEKIQNSNK